MYLLVQDVTAGRCLQDAGQNGRDFTAAEKAAFTQCGFNSMEGFELNEHLECTVRHPPPPPLRGRLSPVFVASAVAASKIGSSSRPRELSQQLRSVP